MSENKKTNEQMRRSVYIRPAIYVIIAICGVVKLHFESMKQMESQNARQEQVKEQTERFDGAQKQRTAQFYDSLQQVK